MSYSGIRELNMPVASKSRIKLGKLNDTDFYQKNNIRIVPIRWMGTLHTDVQTLYNSNHNITVYMEYIL